MQHIKKDDLVIVISGKDKGKKGHVVEVLPKKGKVKVRGVAIVTTHYKARRQGETSAIKKEESYIDISNVVLAREV
jgi:large subunit ribosomal protein L24